MSQSNEIDLEAARQKPDTQETQASDVECEEGMPTSMSAYAINMLWTQIKRKTTPDYPGWQESVRDLFTKSWYNILFIVVPLVFAWAFHFNVISSKWGNKTTFIMCFIAMIPLQKTFDWGGEQMGRFLDKESADLLVITLSNAIEAALAIILLFKCHLRLLQSTIVGVVLLHLLLIPGTSFFVQGARIYEQKLTPQFHLNHSLLMTGVLAILVPTIFFAALDRGSGVVAGSDESYGLPASFTPLVSDAVRTDILKMSRGISIMLLVIYVTSCLYRQNVLHLHKDPNLDEPLASSHASPHRSSRLTELGNSPARPDFAHGAVSASVTFQSQRPHTSDVNPWVCLVLVVAAVGLMTPTAVFLVSSIEPILETTAIRTEWVGLVLLPIVSFSADGAVVIWNFSVALGRHFYRKLRAPKTKKSRINLTAQHPSQNGRNTNKLHRRPLDARREQTLGAPILGDTVSDMHHVGYVEELEDLTPVNSLGLHVEDSSRGTVSSGFLPTISNPTVRARSNTADTKELSNDVEEQKRELELELPWASEFAHGRAIDLSIQFTLWWTPLLVLLGWWSGRPMHLLFDYFEIGMLLGACFLVNYVTDDEKTNMSEGFTMISFYAMIATAAWFYPGQPQVAFMLNCPGSVAQAVANSIAGNVTGVPR